MSRSGQRIIASAREALAFARGETSEGFVVHEFGDDCGGGAEVDPDREAAMPLDVRAIRDRLGLSQADFARRFGFGLVALRGWEQGRNAPAGPARVLLRVIEREPEAVTRALSLPA
jgi:putative transcriptional regulator